VHLASGVPDEEAAMKLETPKSPAPRSKPGPKKLKTGVKAGFEIDGGEG
jgi:hypothetical protein